MENYAVYSLGLMKKLVSKGFEVVDMVRKENNRAVFMFNDTVEFRMALTEITNELNKEKKSGSFCASNIKI